MEGSSWFSKLPDELYLKIFRYLTHPEVCKCMQVCQKWKRLCSDDSLWTEVEVSLTKVASDDVFNRQTRLKVSKNKRACYRVQ